MPAIRIRLILTSLAALVLLAGGAPAAAAEFDLVILNGRVMNPANGLDSVRDVGIRDGRIAALSRQPLSGAAELDAAGLVVAPGFVDLHAHGQAEFEAWLQAQDGVTTQLEMGRWASTRLRPGTPAGPARRRSTAVRPSATCACAS